MIKTIGLDYDDTFSADPDGWYEALQILRDRGFSIIGVTFRDSETRITDQRYLSICDAVIYTAGEPKRNVAQEYNYQIDIWIDDKPEWVTQSWESLYGEVFAENLEKLLWINNNLNKGI